MNTLASGERNASDLGSILRSGLAGVAETLDAALSVAEVEGLSDEELVTALGEVEDLGRRIDALRVSVAADVSERSRPSLGSDGLAGRLGCRNAEELLRRVTLVSGVSARRRIRLGQALLTRASLTGHRRPARFAAVAQRVASGALGLDSVAAIVEGIGPVEARCAPEAWEAAERALVEAAVGAVDLSGDAGSDPRVGDTAAFGSTGAAACPADETRLQALVWRAALDPDGIEPTEERAMRARGLRVAPERDGLMRVTGDLIAPAAAQLVKLLEAHTNPRTTPTFLHPTSPDVADDADAHPPGPDDRSPAQRRHDILVAVIDHAARCAETPSLGGAAPTVIITTTENDLHAHRSGHATANPAGFIEGVQSPVSLATISRYACAGGIQRAVLNDDGGIIQLGSPSRCFTSQQRRAITVRDGGCIIPGCHIPAAWCEVHHVDEHARGGSTHTDNGVLLCWFHHRTLDTSGWRIRMNNAHPQIKAPPWTPGSGRWQTIDPTAGRLHLRYRRARRNREALGA